MKYIVKQEQRSRGPLWPDLRLQIQRIREYMTLYERSVCPDLLTALSAEEEAQLQDLETDLQVLALKECRMQVCVM